MKLLPGIQAVDFSLYCDRHLIIADLHIGFEESLNKQGIFVPRDHFPQLLKAMEDIFRKTKNKKIKKVIINGDLKHEFGRISDQEWRHTLQFLDFIGKHCQDIVLIQGNHDTILGPIAKKRNITIKDHYLIEKHNVLCVHGDTLPPQKILEQAKTIIIGHEHASVSIGHGSRVERYKCFLLGKYKKKNLVVLPSCNFLTEGASLMREEKLSPFLKQDLDDFLVYVVEDKVYRFGRLKDVKQL